MFQLEFFSLKFTKARDIHFKLFTYKLLVTVATFHVGKILCDLLAGFADLCIELLGYRFAGALDVGGAGFQLAQSSFEVFGASISDADNSFNSFNLAIPGKDHFVLVGKSIQ